MAELPQAAALATPLTALRAGSIEAVALALKSVPLPTQASNNVGCQCIMPRMPRSTQATELSGIGQFSAEVARNFVVCERGPCCHAAKC